MIQHPQIDPVALQLGPVAIHWYGLTYLAAFGLFFFLATRRLGHYPYATLKVKKDLIWSRQDIEDILFLGMLGVMIGGRLGYCLFYKPAYYLSHPLEIFYVWTGGMSFHGGLLGVIVAEVWFAKSRGRSLFSVTDFVAPCVPTGVAMGRLGNFINGELYGRAADPSLPWAMVFRDDPTKIARHPSQLYQFALEGLLLFALTWWFAATRNDKNYKAGQTAAVFLMGYGVMRFIVEYFREPDAHLGILSLGMSMGQWLCVPMVLFGAWLWWFAGKTVRN